MLLLVIFWSLPMTLRVPPAESEIREYRSAVVSTAAPARGQVPYGVQLLLEEHQKAVAEIRQRIDQGDAWFYRKMVIVGALLTVFGAALLRFSSKAGPEAVEEVFDCLSRSNATCAVLALAMAIAVSIDIHTRISDSAVHQIALWIRHYAEPTLFGEKQQFGYETYLRLKEPGREGQHVDTLMTFVLRPYGYFLTWSVYLLYLTCFYKVCCRAGRKAVEHMEVPLSGTQQRLTLAGFLLVHFCLGAYGVVAHSAPPAYDLHIWRDAWTLNGRECGLWFFAPFLALVALHSPCWWLLCKGSLRLDDYVCFISHSSKDSLLTEKLIERLREAGLPVWFSREDIHGGHVHKQLAYWIKHSDRFVLILSEASMASDWVKLELRILFDLQDRGGEQELYPLRLVSMEAIESWQFIDYATGEGLAARVLSTCNILDFSAWEDEAKFEALFRRMCKDFRVEYVTPPRQEAGETRSPGL